MLAIVNHMLDIVNYLGPRRPGTYVSFCKASRLSAGSPAAASPTIETLTAGRRVHRRHVDNRADLHELEDDLAFAAHSPSSANRASIADKDHAITGGRCR
jgi:hypothetical protein